MAIVMYLEDDGMLADSIGRYLETLGHEAVVHTNPADGLNEIAPDYPDVLITDYDFGLASSMTGADVAKLVRAVNKDTPIISFSGLDRAPEYADVGLFAEDGIHHISKDGFDDLRELLEALT